MRWGISTLAGLVVLLGATVAHAAAPEGPRLAYLRFAVKPAAVEIYTAAADGSASQRIAGGGREASPLPSLVSPISWSPDGGVIALSGVAHAGQSEISGSASHRIFLAPAEGGPAREVPGTEGGMFPVFAPDGRSIAFVRVVGEDSSWSDSEGHHGRTFARTSIWLIGVDGSDARRLTPVRKSTRELPSSFSPDGVNLAVTVEAPRSEPSTIAVPLAGGAPRLITRRAADAVYSPDGSQIAIARLRDVTRHYMTKDGKTHAYVGTTDDLYARPAAGGDWRRLTDAPGIEEEPAWDPSGTRLAFTRLSTGGTDAAFLGLGDALVEVNADGSCETEVLSRPGSALLSPVWQPGLGREAGPIAC